MTATLERVEGDITKLSVDAIVNAANERLAPGGGVCGAIHRASGPRLAEACAQIGHCPTGEARITPGFDLSAKYVIHAVGPVWHGGTRGESELLANCYRYAIDLARHHKCRSIAFPAISTGIFGYPPEAASRVAVAASRAATANGALPSRVIFVCFGKEMMSIYRKLIEAVPLRCRAARARPTGCSILRGSARTTRLQRVSDSPDLRIATRLKVGGIRGTRGLIAKEHTKNHF